MNDGPIFSQQWYEDCTVCGQRNSFNCKDLTNVYGASKRVIMQCGKCNIQWKGMAPAKCSYSKEKPYIVVGLRVVFPGFF